ncbi:hypothetical protein PSH91_18145 [Pseudomonas sp. FP1154]|jgi:hypothetical protein|uniref:hypothetical protein n=1 Tax=Pseudomonas TaxID=286 RepID=UPI0009536D3F|nr:MULTISPECIES: hypothetical protein [Pseudomonas]MXR28379.1 hypothetical protein [Pseudomonas sp. PICF6]WLG21676.1 hypothetical protein PSH91_18145 [Pseudomonas sp. FP1154]SIR83025.1 hypothetical protein SAMN05216504_2537 [Pseudomonas sp. A214]
MGNATTKTGDVVARGFIPAGLRSSPKTCYSKHLAHRVVGYEGLLCSPAGINPLATTSVSVPVEMNESALIQTKALNLYENYYKLRDEICHYRAIADFRHADLAQG